VSHQYKEHNVQENTQTGHILSTTQTVPPPPPHIDVYKESTTVPLVRQLTWQSPQPIRRTRLNEYDNMYN
jgi:hypothetical protein